MYRVGPCSSCSSRLVRLRRYKSSRRECEISRKLSSCKSTQLIFYLRSSFWICFSAFSTSFSSSWSTEQAKSVFYGEQEHFEDWTSERNRYAAKRSAVDKINLFCNINGENVAEIINVIFIDIKTFNPYIILSEQKVFLILGTSVAALWK